MIIDAFFLFTGGSASPGNSDGKTDSPTTGTQTSSNQVDLGVGTTANPSIPALAANVGGRDLGIGDDPALKLLVDVEVAFTSGTSLQVNVQGAPDNGSAAPGSFTTMATGPVVAEASLVIGARLFDIDLPRQVPGQVLPRFLQLQYVSVGTHVTGKLLGAFVLDRMDQVEQSNAVMGGYPAGITIAN